MSESHKTVLAHEAQHEETDKLWQLYFDRLPAAANFRQLAERDVPNFALEPDS